MAQEITTPFFFRIYSPNEQGIVYRADTDNGHSFMSTGSRQIGQIGTSIIWEVGGYTDAMPKESMHRIMGLPKPMTKVQRIAFVDNNGLSAKYKRMNLYTDENGYWFSERISRSGRRSGSRSGSRSGRRSGSRSGNTRRSRN